MKTKEEIQILLAKVARLEKEVRDLDDKTTEYKSQIEYLELENSKLMEYLVDARDEISFLEAGAVQ